MSTSVVHSLFFDDLRPAHGVAVKACHGHRPLMGAKRGEGLGCVDYKREDLLGLFGLLETAVLASRGTMGFLVTVE